MAGGTGMAGSTRTRRSPRRSTASNGATRATRRCGGGGIIPIVRPSFPPVHEHLMELLLMLDAARGASAARITAVMPHYAYARSDKKDAPRISIGGRLVADLLVTAGAGRGLAMTLHSPQVHGFFTVPVDHL